MHKTFRYLISSVLICAILLGMFPLNVLSAGYTFGDSGYTKLSTLPNTYVATQGMAADDKYVYTFKMPSGDNNRAIIYRTDIATRSTIALTNADDTSTSVLSGLGHGNDMCAVVHNGKTYLYLATMYHIGHSEYSAHSIWKLEVSGTSIRKVAYYDVFDGPGSLNFSGLTLYSQNSTSVRLLGHINSHIFYMDIGLNQASGNVSAGYGCSINYASATVPTGSPAYSSSSYGVQGMTYNNGILYFVMTGNSSVAPQNKNHILAYDVSNLGADTSKRNNLQSESIYLTSSYYSYFLEVESLCAVNGRMYFAANAGSGSSFYSAEDFVGHFNQYFNTYPEGVLLEFDNGSRETSWAWRHYIGTSATPIAPHPTAANGTLSGTLGVKTVDGQTSTDSFVRMTASDVYYRICSGDIVEIGMNYHRISGTPPTTSAVFCTTDKIGYFTAERMFDCAHIFTEGKNTLQYNLTSISGAAVGEIISQLRIDLFEGGSSDFSAEYMIDYIYIGSRANSPGNIEAHTGKGTKLYLDFDALSPMRNNSDWIGNNVSFNINQNQGIFSGTIIGSDPYFHLTNDVNYRPAAGDILDIRIKHNITSGNYGGLEFFYTTSDAPNFSGDMYLAHTASSYSNAYQTIRLALPSSMVGKTVTKIRIDPVSSAASEALKGTFEIDYIYLGPSNGAPSTTCTVRFCNENGTLLESKSVLSGNAVSYTGQTPTKSYDNTYHYTFAGWVDANGKAANLNSVTADITLYASFKAQSHSYAQSVLKAATCEENGLMQYKCTCGYSKNETIEKTPHTSKQTAYKAPTCTESGLSEGTYCSVCGLTLTAQAVIPALGHTEVIDQAVAPTCTQSGLTQGKHCSVCNTVIVKQTSVSATGHSAVTDVSVHPTCTESGLSSGSHCSVCKKVLTAQVVIPALGHTEVIDQAVAPTCTESGLTEGKHCSVCGTVLQPQTTVAAASHTVLIDQAVAPTCTESGLTEGKHCAVCNAVLLAPTEVPATGHSYGTGTVTQEPTCIREGIKTYTCHCGSSYNESLAKVGHSMVLQPERAATCEENGCAMHYACALCEATFVDADGKYPLPMDYLVTPATGHNIFYREKTAPTCTEVGYNSHYCCRTCQKTYADASGIYPLPTSYVILAPLGHSLTYTDLGADHIVTCKHCTYFTQESHSFVERVCVCGAIESNDPILDRELKFSMNISAGAEMVVNYSFMANVVSKYDEFWLEVEKNVAGSESVITIYNLDTLERINNPVTGAAILYNAAYRGINAKEMGDNFATTLYALDANGKLCRSETVVSSIRDFLLSKLDDASSSAEMKTMAVDMLKYGAAAQLHFGYAVDALVTEGLTSAQLAYATALTPSASNTSGSVGNGANVATNITVRSKVELNLSCICTTVNDPNAVKCIILDENGTILAELPTEAKSGVMFAAKYDNVGAKQMRKVITATFFEGGKPISKTVRWSVESYVAQTRERANATQSEIALVNAMLTYGDAVAAYMSIK